MATDAASLPENTPRKPRPFGWARRLLRAFLHPGRKLSGEERREINAGKLERARLKGKRFELAAEAEIFGAAIPQKLAQLGICYRYRRGERGLQKTKLVELRRPYVLTESALYFEVDMRSGRLPHGIGIERLEDPATLRNLSTVIGHPVTARAPSDGGFWFIVEREFGVRGIPRHVDYNEMLLRRSASYSGLFLPLGVTENKKDIWRDLGDMPHMLVAGSTMSGKSNALNSFLCTLLRFNSSRMLRLVLVDLKGGIEFSRYEGVPHVWKVSHRDGADEQAIIHDREKVIPWLRRVMQLGEDRMKVLREQRLKNIGEYNKRHAHEHRQLWPYVVVVIDEWADILQDKAISADAAELLMNLVARLRAVGVHAIVCTQVPTAEVVSTRLKTNLQAKLALSVGTLQGSMAILGDGSAVGLEPQGRGIFTWGKRPIMLQMPRVTESTIDAVVSQAIARKFDKVVVAEHDVTDQEIFDWAISDNNGDLDYMALFKRFRYRRVTQDWAEAFCKRAEGDQVVVGTTTYEVVSAAGNRPRRLLPVKDAEPTAAELALDASGPELDPLEPPEMEATAACRYCGQPMTDGRCEQCGGPPVATSAPAEPVTHQELWEWAVRQNGGSLAVKQAYANFKTRGLAQRAVSAMCALDPPLPIFIDGQEYAIAPAEKVPGKGALPRRLMAVDRPALSGEDGDLPPLAGPDVLSADGDESGEATE